MVQPDTEQIII